MSSTPLNMTDAIRNPAIPESINTKQGISNEANGIVGSTKEKQEAKLAQNAIASEMSGKLARIIQGKESV